MEAATEAGLAIPEPSKVEDEYSGRFVVRIPRTLHRRLVQSAQSEAVSLNQLCLTFLAAGLERQTSETIRSPVLRAAQVRARHEFRSMNEFNIHRAYRLYLASREEPRPISDVDSPAESEPVIGVASSR
jgi:hypothetical protein